MVDFQVEAVKKEFGLFEASALVRGFPIENIEVDMVEKEG